VIVTDTVLSVTTGEPILENPVTLSLAVTTGNAGAAVSGSDLWLLTVFTNDAADGQGVILFEKELPGTTDAGWTDVDFDPAGNTFMLNGISVTFDLTNIICFTIPYICLNLSKADSSSTDFTLDSNPVTALSDCVEIDCRDIYIFPASLTFNRDFHEDLNDPSSTAFKNQSSDITDFFSSSLSLNDEIIIQIRSFSPGSIIAYVNFNVLNTNISYDDFLEILTQEVIRIAENSDGYLFPDSIVISST
ncbi:uncharacterized protein LOC117125247, partial [Anneissia japonica]|uniref:uncharacterized protein LOC117125247 n=1 Tax=Anneissia japonica TaxID=1529436 RepID=UPI0014257FDC